MLLVEGDGRRVLRVHPELDAQKPVPALGRLDQGADQLIADAAAMVIGMHRQREAGDVALTDGGRAIEHRKATEAPALEGADHERARRIEILDAGAPRLDAIEGRASEPARHAGNAGDRVDRGCVTELERAQGERHQS